MYRIAICDDERTFCEEFSALVGELMEELGVRWELDTFASCEKLHRALRRQGAAYHILFLDILMKGMDGMELAQLLRREGEESTIVFVSCTDRYMKQGYDVSARQYLEKPVHPAELRHLLAEDYQRRFLGKHLAVRQGGGAVRSIPAAQLVCLEAKGRKLVYHMLDESVSVYATGRFDNLEESLPEGFVRCHRSYYLNLDNVEALRRTEALAKNGQMIPVSRSRSREVQEAFLRQVRRRTIIASS